MHESIIIHRPHGPLVPLISHMWHREDSSPVADEYIFPQGTHYLMVNLGDSPVRLVDPKHSLGPILVETAALDGTHTRTVIAERSSSTKTMGIVFRPGAIPSLFGFSAKEILNEIVLADGINALRKLDLKERLLAIGSIEERFQGLEGILLSILPDRPVSIPGIDAAVRTLDRLSIKTRPIQSLVNQSGMTHSRFIREFADQVGLTPKCYARLARFRAALRSIDEDPARSLTSLAHELGYYDQAHFIHDFRDLAGMPPTQYIHQFRGHARWSRETN